MKRTSINLSSLLALPECLAGSYCVRFGEGFMAQAHRGLDWSIPTQEVNEQRG